MSDRFVSYFRVSTDKQGRSGLGLEAQASAVAAYVDQRRGRVVESFTEVESGKRNDRPQLQKAIKYAKLQGATLLVAKLDRLSRSSTFINLLMDSQSRFVCADMPEANELTVRIMAAMAEHERKMISERTRAALAEAKKRGVKLGNPRIHELRNYHPVEALNARLKKADEYAANMADVLEDMPEDLSLNGIAAELERREILTARGKSNWSATQVRNLKLRIEGIQAA